MKKAVLIAGLAVAAMAATGCDTKLCYCYETTNSGTMYEEETYISEDSRCNSLNNSRRSCIESNEQRLNVNDIGVTPGMKGLSE